MGVRSGSIRRVTTVLAVVLGAYVVVRGVAEFFVIDWSNPRSYRSDWGGPSLAGVLAVHVGPAVLALIAAAGWLWRAHAPYRRGTR
jgi:uncharacterized membrane protein HdeD (DUF308 family)